MDRLQLGVAYHSNRITRHVLEDLDDIIAHGFDSVLHMYTHNDMERHAPVMRDLFSATLDRGLELWVDNWGLGGAPGDSSHFLSYAPEARQIFNDGEPWKKMVCLNSPAFVGFTKEWIDCVYDAGGRKIFWDEPCLCSLEPEGGRYRRWTCACPLCQELFAARYGHAMPKELTDEVRDFRRESVLHYFRQVADYAREKGMENAVCLMPGDQYGVTMEDFMALPQVDNVGTDPYWVGTAQGPEAVYRYVRRSSEKALALDAQYGKKHNIWVQGFGIPAGREEEIVTAADAVYDAGARSIWVWSFRGGESNSYRCANPELAWQRIGEAMSRLRGRDRDRQWELCRKSYENQGD